MYMAIIVKHLLCNRMADQAKLHGRGTKVCVNGHGNLPKMAAMAIKCKKKKNFKKCSSLEPLGL